MISPPCDSPEQLGRWAALGPVARVGPAVVVNFRYCPRAACRARTWVKNRRRNSTRHGSVD